jgi:hypothetical protein
MNLPRLFLTPCEHERVMVLRSAGLERVVCENCGHVSFSFDEEELMASTELAISATAGAETD